MLLLLWQGGTSLVNMTGGTVLTKASGPAFTRKRYREIIAAEEAAKEAKREAIRLEKRAARELARAEAKAARETLLEARTAQEQAWAEQERARQLSGARSTFDAVQQIKDAAHRAAIMEAGAKYHHRLAQDEDEALALLLLNG